MFNRERQIRINYCKKKDKGNEVTYDVTTLNVSSIFECGRKNPDVSYERAYIATEVNEYFTDILDHLNGYQDCHCQIFSSKKVKDAVIRVTEQQEE